MDIGKLDKLHKTNAGYAAFGLVELAFSCLFASLAINSGSLWEWALAVILLAGAFQNILKLITKLIYGNNHKASKAR